MLASPATLAFLTLFGLGQVPDPTHNVPLPVTGGLTSERVEVLIHDELALTRIGFGLINTGKPDRELTVRFALPADARIVEVQIVRSKGILEGVPVATRHYQEVYARERQTGGLAAIVVPVPAPRNGKMRPEYELRITGVAPEEEVGVRVVCVQRLDLGAGWIHYVYPARLQEGEKNEEVSTEARTSFSLSVDISSDRKILDVQLHGFSGEPRIVPISTHRQGVFLETTGERSRDLILQCQVRGKPDPSRRRNPDEMPTWAARTVKRVQSDPEAVFPKHSSGFLVAPRVSQLTSRKR
jgi:hypothetical protein